MNTRILTLTLGLALGATALFAQYPTIPDSVKARGAAEEAVWNQLDQVAWQKAVPIVMEQMLDGKPLYLWPTDPRICDKPRFRLFREPRAAACIVSVDAGERSW
jgi:hypothetical protein